MENTRNGQLRGPPAKKKKTLGLWKKRKTKKSWISSKKQWIPLESSRNGQLREPPAKNEKRKTLGFFEKIENQKFKDFDKKLMNSIGK